MKNILFHNTNYVCVSRFVLTHCEQSSHAICGLSMSGRFWCMCENEKQKIKLLHMIKLKCKKELLLYEQFDKMISILMAVVVLVTIYGVIEMYFGKIRFDQYAMDILGTTAGIVGTMFGLTAASYAFIWGALKSDGGENRHLEKVLETYKDWIWLFFMRSLLLTVLVVFSSLGGMALAQKLAETNLYKTVSKGGETFAKYYNQKYECISWLVLLNLYFSVTVVGIMARMNWIIFNRDVQYAAIAESNLKSVCEKYDMELEEEKKRSLFNKKWHTRRYIT